jgi:hypothetical protein
VKDSLWVRLFARKEIDQIADLRFVNRKGIEKPDFDVGVRIKCGDETIII